LNSSEIVVVLLGIDPLFQNISDFPVNVSNGYFGKLNISPDRIGV